MGQGGEKRQARKTLGLKDQTVFDKIRKKGWFRTAFNFCGNERGGGVIRIQAISFTLISLYLLLALCQFFAAEKNSYPPRSYKTKSIDFSAPGNHYLFFFCPPFFPLRASNVHNPEPQLDFHLTNALRKSSVSTTYHHPNGSDTSASHEQEEPSFRRFPSSNRRTFGIFFYFFLVVVGWVVGGKFLIISVGCYYLYCYRHLEKGCIRCRSTVKRKRARNTYTRQHLFQGVAELFPSFDVQRWMFRWLLLALLLSTSWKKMYSLPFYHEKKEG